MIVKVSFYREFLFLLSFSSIAFVRAKEFLQLAQRENVFVDLEFVLRVKFGDNFLNMINIVFLLLHFCCYLEGSLAITKGIIVLPADDFAD